MGGYRPVGWLGECVLEGMVGPFTVHGSRLRHYKSKLSSSIIYSSRFTVHSSQFTVHVSQFTVHDSDIINQS